MKSQKVFFNPSQPQTLQIGVMLLYLNAGFDLLFGSLTGAVFGLFFGLVIVAALALGAFGIDHVDMPATPVRIWTAIANARRLP